MLMGPASCYSCAMDAKPAGCHHGGVSASRAKTFLLRARRAPLQVQVPLASAPRARSCAKHGRVLVYACWRSIGALSCKAQCSAVMETHDDARSRLGRHPCASRIAHRSASGAGGPRGGRTRAGTAQQRPSLRQQHLRGNQSCARRTLLGRFLEGVRPPGARWTRSLARCRAWGLVWRDPLPNLTCLYVLSPRRAVTPPCPPPTHPPATPANTPRRLTLRPPSAALRPLQCSPPRPSP